MTLGYIISPRNRSQGTTKVLRKSVCIPWLYSVSLFGDSILIDIMINQIKAPFVPLKGNLPVIRNFLERSAVLPASAHLHKVYPTMWLISRRYGLSKNTKLPTKTSLRKTESILLKLSSYHACIKYCMSYASILNLLN